MGLLYVGNGWLPGVPTRDLTEDEANGLDRDWLLASGLYAEKQAAPKRQNKLAAPDSNKAEPDVTNTQEV